MMGLKVEELGFEIEGEIFFLMIFIGRIALEIIV